MPDAGRVNGAHFICFTRTHRFWLKEENRDRIATSIYVHRDTRKTDENQVLFRKDHWSMLSQC